MKEFYKTPSVEVIVFGAMTVLVQSDGSGDSTENINPYLDSLMQV